MLAFKFSTTEPIRLESGAFQALEQIRNCRANPTVVTHRKTVYNAPEWPFADADVAKMTRLDDVLARSECAKTTNIAGDVFPEQLL